MRQLKIIKQITNREAASLDKYLHEISKMDLLTPDEEADLASKVRHGDEEALRKLIQANLRFVVSVAKQYQNQGLSLPDLINEGNLGLIKAAKRFDETRGFKFISYAVWWILQSIMQALAEQARIVRLPLNKIGTINKINRVFTRLEQIYEREPSFEELSLTLKMAPENIKEAVIFNGRPVSMDAPLANSNEGNTLHDVLLNDETHSPDKELVKDSLRQEIERVLKTLPQREAEIVRFFYGLSGNFQHSLDEIAVELNLTRERVRQLREKAIKRLKANTRCKLLRAYL